jgi:hypothetical protein
MKELLEKYGDRLRSVQYYPKNSINKWKLTIRGEETEVDGRLMKQKDTKIFTNTFEDLGL